jgi:molybdate/tungstate transport system substrate-binding protein
MVPQYADWYGIFARNQMVLIYTPSSKFAKDINSSNWFEILLRTGVQSGHSDPDADPAGYRTLLVWQLAAKYYQKPDLYEQLNKTVPAKNIRPKSVELVALLESGELDYIYGYRSVAEQNKLPFITLPSEIDLSDPSKADLYSTVSVEVAGSRPGEKKTMKGLPILFALTIPKNAPHKHLAAEFIRFALSSEGQEIMKRRHLTLVSPPLANDLGKLPAGLQKVFAPLGKNTGKKK